MPEQSQITEKLNICYQNEAERIGKYSGDNGDYANPVFPIKSSGAEIMLIGEAPGKDEVEQGRAFVGKAGKQLDELLTIAGLNREQVFITNAVKYRPYIKSIGKNGKASIRNRTPSKEELLTSAQTLSTEIELVNPKIIVTLGNSPLWSVCHIFGLKLEKIGECHGQFIDLQKGIKLFPIYHPASGIYNRALIEVMEADLLILSRYVTEQGII